VFGIGSDFGVGGEFFVSATSLVDGDITEVVSERLLFSP
jgi:hypothetical protein